MPDAQVKRPARGANSTPAGKATKQRRKSTPRRFEGTENPRYLRILAALLARARTREEIDRTAGASNGPAAIAELRALGLPKPAYLPCVRTRC